MITRMEFLKAIDGAVIQSRQKDHNFLPAEVFVQALAVRIRILGDDAESEELSRKVESVLVKS